MKISDVSGPGRELIPAKTHVAVCVGSADIGTQWSTYKGKPPKWRRKCVLFWQVPSVLIDVNGESMPAQISRILTFSMFTTASMRPIVEAHFGGRTFSDDECRNFDTGSLVGRWVRIKVDHKEKANKYVTEMVTRATEVDDDFVPPAFEFTPICYEIRNGGELVVNPPANVTDFVRRMVDLSREFTEAKVDTVKLNQNDKRNVEHYATLAARRAMLGKQAPSAEDDGASEDDGDAPF